MFGFDKVMIYACVVDSIGCSWYDKVMIYACVIDSIGCSWFDKEDEL